MVHVMPSTDAPAIGATVRVLRTEAGLTLRQLASLAEVSPHYVRQVEAGTKTPSRQWVSRVSIAIGKHIAAVDRAQRSVQ